MQFCVQREVFLKLLRMVSGAVEKRQGIHPILSHVLIRAEQNNLSAVSSDREVELIACTTTPVDVSEPGAFAVPFRKLSDICKAMREKSPLSLTTEGSKVVLRSGRSRFVLSSLPSEQFPLTQHKPGMLLFSLLQKQLRWLIEKTAFAMADQDVRYFLNGMLLEVKQDRLFAVAADGHRLMLNKIHLNGSVSPVRVIIPRKGILEILRMLDEGEEEIRIALSRSYLQLQMKNMILTSKLLEGKFPDYEQVIPKGGGGIVIGDREQFREAFLRAAALFSDKFRGVKLILSSNRLKIIAQNTEKDEVEEDLEVSYQGEPLEIGFNVRYLIDFLTVLQTKQVQFTFKDASGSALIEGVGDESGAYVLMPMRI